MNRRGVVHRTVAAAVAVLLAAGCSSGSGASAPTAATTATTAPTATSVDLLAGRPPGQAGCQPASPIASVDIPEVLGTATSGQHLHGLLLRTQSPVAVGDTLKVVWRMTGTGDLTATATAPDGTDQRLDWGPEAHSSSSYLRPGDEWGVGYRFTQPGCWHLHLARADSEGDVWLEVAPLAASNLSQPSADLDCQTATDVDPPGTGYATSLDSVALPTDALQANPSGDASSDRALFAKHGLVLRSGASFDLVIPTSDQGVATMGWGRVDTPTKIVRVRGCTTRDPAKAWLAYPGGFWVARPACVSLVVVAGARQVAVPVGVGAACPGQGPAPEPSG